MLDHFGSLIALVIQNTKTCLHHGRGLEEYLPPKWRKGAIHSDSWSRKSLGRDPVGIMGWNRWDPTPPKLISARMWRQNVHPTWSPSGMPSATWNGGSLVIHVFSKWRGIRWYKWWVWFLLTLSQKTLKRMKWTHQILSSYRTLDSKTVLVDFSFKASSAGFGPTKWGWGVKERTPGVKIGQLLCQDTAKDQWLRLTDHPTWLWNQQ